MVLRNLHIAALMTILHSLSLSTLSLNDENPNQMHPGKNQCTSEACTEKITATSKLDFVRVCQDKIFQGENMPRTVSLDELNNLINIVIGVFYRTLAIVDNKVVWHNPEQFAMKVLKSMKTDPYGLGKAVKAFYESDSRLVDIAEEIAQLSNCPRRNIAIAFAELLDVMITSTTTIASEKPE